MPKFDDRGAAYARFAMRGGLTRLALMFDAGKKYTGGEVQQILITAMLTLDRPGLDLTMQAPDLLDIRPDVVRDMLLVASLEVPLTDIAGWTPTELIAAANWAIAVHLVASDNALNDFCRAHDEDSNYDPAFRCICIPPKPAFLNAYPPPKPFPMLERTAQ